MTGRHWALVALIVVEVIAGALILRRPRTRPVPPVPDLAFVDAAAADQLRARAAKCDSPDDWDALGEAYLAYGYFPEAEACYRVASLRERASPERAYRWAFALERIGWLEEANTEYERAATTGHPHPDECRYFIGRNHLRLERAEEARAAFEAAGDHPAARYERARLLARSGRDAEAVPLLETLAREHPRAIQPYLLLHRGARLRNDAGAARYADLAGRAPGRLPTPFDKEWNRLESTHARLGQTAELAELRDQIARRELAGTEPRLRAVLAAGWNFVAADLLAEVEMLRGRPAEAVRLLQDALDREGPSVHLLERLGDAHDLSGRGAVAAELWSRAAELGVGAGVKNLHYRLGEYHEKAGNAAYAKSRSARAFLAAGHELFWTGKPHEARPAFEKAAEIEPTMAAAWFYLGETDRLLGQVEQARKGYDRCLSLNPDHDRALAGRALLLGP